MYKIYKIYKINSFSSYQFYSLESPSVFLLVTYFLLTVGLPIGPSIRLPIGQKRKCFDWSNLSVAVFFPPHPLLAYSELCQVPQFYSSYLSSYFTYLLLQVWFIIHAVDIVTSICIFLLNETRTSDFWTKNSRDLLKS